MRFLKQIETLFRAGTTAQLTDAQLLDRFLERRDEAAQAAFAALVDRHAAMVLRICRQILRDEQDAEDAAQATFLVLARRASSISQRESLACWLHGVALRVAAKSRAAALRRRTHERQEAEMRAAGQIVEPDTKAIESHDDWARLHEELRQLPQSFRQPLILCYFDGLTQEQAAAQLRCPLGTIQSRLSRGRAKLKSRLERKGITLAPIFAGMNQLPISFTPVPQAWCEATTRLSMQFAKFKSHAIAGSGSASVVLAEAVVRALVMAKVKLALGTIASVALLLSGAVTAWAVHKHKTPTPTVITNTELNAPAAEAPPAPETAQRSQANKVRTIRGIVRDEQGHPVVNAWIGDKVQLSDDVWSIVEPPDRIRARSEPFRDQQGKIVPAGALGTYFELKDGEGKWRPLHPSDVRRFHAPVVSAGLPPLPLEALNLSNQTLAAIENGKDVFEARIANGRLMMIPIPVSSPVPERRSSANRTDSEGRFSVQANLSSPWRSRSILFASADFSKQAVAVVNDDDSDGMIEITLRPQRVVRARVILKSKVKPRENVEWRLFTLGQTTGKLDWVRAIRADGEHWDWGLLGDPNTTDGGNERCRLEMRMPAGHYKVSFTSDTIDRVVDVNVPPGTAPLELPNIELEARAWFQMLGKPAAEIAAIDLSGSAAKLAEYKGKVVVLVWWNSLYSPYSQFIARLAELRNRFEGQPLAILALHDATIKSVASLGEALRRLREQIGGEVPIRFLLEQPSVARKAPRALPQWLEFGSGRTADIYEHWTNQTAIVVDRDGKLVYVCGPSSNEGYNFAVGRDGHLVFSDEFGAHEDDLKSDSQLGTLSAALEDLFGLRRIPFPKPTRPDRPEDFKRRRIVFKGKVVDHTGKPVAGARLASLDDLNWKNAVKSAANGEFALDTAISWHLQ